MFSQKSQRGISLIFALFFASVSTPSASAEEIRVNIADTVEVSREKPQGSSIALGFSDSAAVLLERDTRFLLGIEIELSAPQAWLSHHGELAVVIYTELSRQPVKGTVELEAKRVRADSLASRIQTVYQIPLKKEHNLKTNPYSVLLQAAAPNEFPLIVRLMPIVKELSEEINAMRFQLTARPILSAEGSVRINIRFPQNLQNRPFTMLIDDKVVENSSAERFFEEGEHHLMLISNDYRNESRRFVIERGKMIELNINLQDLTPLLIFEAPDNARIFLDNVRVPQPLSIKAVEPGHHEVKIQLSDWTIIKSVYVQKGKTYRVSFAVDITVSEED